MRGHVRILRLTSCPHNANVAPCRHPAGWGNLMKRTAAEIFNAADLDWHHALIDAFGKDAGQVRYEARGAGEPGTPLRAAYDARMAAFRNWRAAA